MTDRRRFLCAASLAMSAAFPVIAQSQEASADVGALPAGIHVPKFELLYECDATLLPARVGYTRDLTGTYTMALIFGSAGLLAACVIFLFLPRYQARTIR